MEHPKTFLELAFTPKLQQAIEEAGFKEPSPIQAQSIPRIMAGRDLVGQAQTGTGKTAAFGLPILEFLNQEKKLPESIFAVVLVPTRELAIQVAAELGRFGRFLNVKTATVYGGQPYTAQIRAMKNSQILVATPGRLIDHLSNGKISLKPQFVVLDEADEMLNMGFLEDIRKIFSYLSGQHQNLLFSATMPSNIKKLIAEFLYEPEYVTLNQKIPTGAHIDQSFYVVDEHERDDALVRLYSALQPLKSIIFCRTKKEVDRLAYFLASQGYEARGLHGDMEQKNRESVIKAFRNSSLEILVATDVAARGLDVNDVSHVFNYHLPFDTESYVHRIGRTGRAGKEGKAVSIVTPYEYRSLQRIHKTIGGNLAAKSVPHSREISDQKIAAFIESLVEQDIDERAYEIMDMLKEKMELSTIAFKLISMLKEHVEVPGKAKIGKSEKELQHFLSRANSAGGRQNPRAKQRNRPGSFRHKPNSGRVSGGRYGQNKGQNQNKEQSKKQGKGQNKRSKK